MGICLEGPMSRPQVEYAQVCSRGPICTRSIGDEFMLLKTHCCALVILLAALGAVATDVQSQTSSTGWREMSVPKVRFPSGKEVVEVPFEVEGSWMVIPVSVNGSSPLRYVFDSGASGAIHYNS